MKGMKIVVVVYFAQPEIGTFIESVRDTFHRCLQIRTVQHFIQKNHLKKLHVAHKHVNYVGGGDKMQSWNWPVPTSGVIFQPIWGRKL